MQYRILLIGANLLVDKAIYIGNQISLFIKVATQVHIYLDLLS